MYFVISMRTQVVAAAWVSHLIPLTVHRFCARNALFSVLKFLQHDLKLGIAPAVFLLLSIDLGLYYFHVNFRISFPTW